MKTFIILSNLDLQKPIDKIDQIIKNQRNAIKCAELTINNALKAQKKMLSDYESKQ